MADEIVHVVDDDDAIRDSIGFLLASADIGVRVYAGAEELLARASNLEPGCVLTDIRMPGMSGLDLVREFRRLGLPHPIIVLTGHADVALAVAAMKAGVADFLEKPVDEAALLLVLRRALATSVDLVSRQREQAEIEQRVGQLTPRELDVFQAVVEGDSNKEAAIRLGISPRTVEIYRANVMAKMRASSLSDLVRMALRRQNTTRI